MKDANSRHKRRNSRADSQDLTVVGINYNVGPDAEDRLRRIFTILLRHTARDRQAATEKDAPDDAPPAEDQSEEKAG